MQSANLNCERDEFPPAVIWQARDGGDAQWLRFLPRTQNVGAGQLASNPCYPLTLVNEPGFALMWEDSYYDTNVAAHQFAINNYQFAPAPAITQGHVNLPGYNKRQLTLDMSVDPENVAVVDGNFIRKATDQ